MKRHLKYAVTTFAVRLCSFGIAAVLLGIAPLSIAQTGGSTTTPTGRQTTGSAAGDNHGTADVIGNKDGSQHFIVDAIEGNLAEVKLGLLAQKRGVSEQVKSFGKMLEKDHGAANNEAKQVAQTLNVSVPTAPNKKQKATYDKLSKLSGDDFDKQFVKAMIDDHKKDIRKYELESKEKDVAGSYTEKTLPKLREHLQMAESIK